MEKMWGGIFDKEINEKVEEYTSSTAIDKVLSIYDAKYSIVHAETLYKRGILNKEEVQKITTYLEDLIDEIREDEFSISSHEEDIHSVIENYLQEKIGDVAKKLHVGRSRNDQVMVSTRLYCKDKIDTILENLNKLCKRLLQLAKENEKIIIPAYTHLQRAQPVLFSHYILAYVNMLRRDIQRLSEVKIRVDSLPAGSAACTGTGVDLDLSYIARKLGFSNISENSLDAVSDRDFMMEILSDLSIMFMHFSRLCEDLILWYSSEFNMIEIDESFCTGSSIMPQKRNPDVLELIRGNTGNIYGRMVAMGTLLKGLPLSYNRDLQLDKESLFKALESTIKTINVLNPLIKSIEINKNRAKELLKDDSLYVTDVAEWLSSKGMPFREAHKLMGKVLKYCKNNDISFNDLSLDKLKNFSSLFDEEVYELFDSANSVKRKKTSNSTNPKVVSKKISNLLKEFS